VLVGELEAGMTAEQAKSEMSRRHWNSPWVFDPREYGDPEWEDFIVGDHIFQVRGRGKSFEEAFADADRRSAP
jgi:hypothetical protein